MRGSGDLVLYLDLDGVVHHEAVYQGRRGIYMSPTEAPGRCLFEWVDALVELMEPFPSIRLVLSSSWCRRPGYSRTLRRLPEELRARFIGGTFHRRVHGGDPGAEVAFASLPRGVQVVSDVTRRQPRDWLALDDDDLDWPAEQRSHLVLCDGALGLSSRATQIELAASLADMVYPMRPPVWTDLPDHIRARLDAADMRSVEAVAGLLEVDGEAIEALIRSGQLLAICSPGRGWHLPVWQFVEPLHSLIPKILAARALDGWGSLLWLETPQGALQGLTPRAAIEQGLATRVLQLAKGEGDAW